MHCGTSKGMQSLYPTSERSPIVGAEPVDSTCAASGGKWSPIFGSGNDVRNVAATLYGRQ